MPFNVAYYQWTDPNTTGLTDPFTIQWTASCCTNPSSWVASVVPPQLGKALGGSYCGCKQAGDPIDTGTGNVSYSVTDYTSAGANPLDFTRYYNSRALAPTFAVSLAHNWRDTYDRYLDIVSATSVTAERANGQLLQFTWNGSTWQSDSDVDITLTQTGSGTGSTWTLKDSDDTIETYTQVSTGEGLLASIKDRDGYTQTMHYNSSNQLTSVTDSFNRTLTFTYQNGLLNTFTTPDGLTLTYGYSSSGLTAGVNDQLASVSYSDSSDQWLYNYLGLGFLLSFIKDTFVSGGTTTSVLYRTWSYDAAGRGTASANGVAAANVIVAYDDSTGNRTVTNALGQQEVYKFATLQGVPKIVEIDRVATTTVPAGTETFTYDSNGYLASQTDWNGNVTTYVNDAHGQPTSITQASGTPLARTTTITYDSTFIHLPHQVVAPRETTTYTYDASGNLLTLTQTDTSGGPTNGQTRTWSYTYDALGHVLTMTGPRTDVTQITTYTYSGNNVATLTDALGHVTSYTSYTASGLLLSMTDPNGVVTTSTYDLEGRLLSTTVQAASGNATTTFSYQTLANTTNIPSQITLPDGSVFSFTYDGADQVTQENEADGHIVYTRDANEDITQQQVINASNFQIKFQSATFDTLGREIVQVGGSGQTTRYTYDADGNRLSTQDPLGHTTTNTYDALNRMITSVDPLGNTTTYAYDAQDNLISVTDPRGLTTTYAYDGFGQVLSQTSPDTGTTTYTLDKAGNIISQKDARGVVTNRTFDKLNRVLTETYPASAGENITYSYDAHSATNFGIGHLTGITDASGTTAYTYNERGDVLTDTRTINGKSYTTSYSYDLADHVLGITYPSGDVVTYTRDAVGRISSATYKAAGSSTTTTLVSTVTYDPFGPVTGLTFGNGVITTYIYNQDERLLDIVTQAGSSILQDLNIVYDNAGNISLINDILDSSRSQFFSYDADNRLIAAGGKYGTQSYTYDADGNRTSLSTSVSTTTYTYAATSNQLTSTTTGSSTCAFTYAPNGDQTAENCGFASASNPTYAANSTYGNRNTETQALVRRNPPPGASFQSSSATAAYQYNALGERVLKTVTGAGAGVTSYTYDESGDLLAESNGTSGAVTREYAWVNGLPVAQIEANGTIYYIHTDQEGTPQKMTDATQAVVWDRVQDPFGNTLTITGTPTDNLRFPGQYFDSETGLNYNLNRSLDPSTGRYTQADPIGLNGGLNEYAYVDSNPLTRVDSTGLDVKIYGGGKLGLHQTVTVDTNSGTYYFGFGPKWGGYDPLGPGEIDEGKTGYYSNNDGGNVLSTYPLSLDNGDKLVQRLRQWEMDPPLYILVGFNCHDFANTVASYANSYASQEFLPPQGVSYPYGITDSMVFGGSR